MMCINIAFVLRHGPLISFYFCNVSFTEFDLWQLAFDTLALL